MLSLIASALLAITGTFGQCPPAKVVPAADVPSRVATGIGLGFNARNLGVMLVAQDPYWGLYFEAEEAGCVVSMGRSSAKAAASETLNLLYSTDTGMTWKTFDSEGGSTPIALANVGDRVYFKAGPGGNTRTGMDTMTYHYFTTSKRCKSGGNIMSLLDGEDRWNRTLPSNMANTFILLFSLTKITTPPDLPATTLSSACYYNMFSGCENLGGMPELPATELTDSCYYGMFRNCISLTNVVPLTAIEAKEACYEEMFQGCAGLVSPPKINATALAVNCYASMFRDCTSLVRMPRLQATRLALGCYADMFYGCSSLTEVQDMLPAETLASECYSGMFSGCSSLVKAPYLPALTLTDGCYLRLFNGCSSLSEIKVAFTNWGSLETAGWVYNVAPSGIFRCPEELGNNSTIQRGNDYCPANWNVVNPYWGMYFEAEEAGCEVNMVKSGSGFVNATMEYTIDEGATWQAFDVDNSTTPITLTNKGDRVYFRAGAGGNTALGGTGGTRKFTLSKKAKAGGNVMSLLDGDDKNNMSLTRSNTFSGLFLNCSNLTAAPRLPATTLAYTCYYQMFRGCTGLELPPELPATALASQCYWEMFYACSNLVVSPVLPATTVISGCYRRMFGECVSLVSTPSLPAEVAEQNCYYEMFQNCRSIVQPPTLPAKRLNGSSVYSGMFQGCTALKSVPAIAATNLSSSCYALMFDGCTSLTDAPDLPIESLQSYCYYQMFRGCTSLTNPPSVLPARTTAAACYQGMFEGCIALPYGPEIMATDKSNNQAYQTMFNGCAALNYLRVHMTEWGGTTAWLYGVSPTGTLSCPYELGTPSTIARGASRCPDGWNVANQINFGLYFEAEEGNCVVNMVKTGTPTAVSMEYSRNEGWDWGYFDAENGTTPITLTNAGDKVWLRAGSSGNTSFAGGASIISAGSNNHRFSLSKKAKSGGDIMVLLDGTKKDNKLLPASFTFAALFRYCDNLTSPPELPATNSMLGCYRFMFDGCSSLSNAPPIESTIWSNYCYNSMFRDCSKLNYITVGFSDWGNFALGHRYWVANVADQGTFACPSALGTDSTIQRGVDYCPLNWKVFNYDYCMYFEAEEAGCVVNMTKMGTGTVPSVELEYSIDNGLHWNTFDACSALATSGTQGKTPVTLAHIGDRVYFRAAKGGNSNLSSSASVYRKFTLSKKAKAGGNIMSLLDGIDSNLKIISSTYAFTGLFQDCTNLTQAPELPATNIHTSAYYNMFYGCSNLTTAPNLPATKIANNVYRGMFRNCVSLINAPELPATEINPYCYQDMFNGCTSLRTALTVLPAGTLKTSCYQSMFDGCSALTNSPLIMATTTAPYSLRYMFRNCTQLNRVEVKFGTWPAASQTTSWLDGTAATGTFVCPAALGTDANIQRGSGKCPTGWTVVNP